MSTYANRKLRYIKNILVWLDQGVNVLLGGDPDETISSRLGKCHRGDHGKTVYHLTLPFWFIVNCIFYIFDGWDHCGQEIEDDEGKYDILNIR